MAESVHLPGIGQVKRGYVYAGAAVVAGVLAVAYYRSSNAAAAPATSSGAGADPSGADAGAVGMPSDVGTGGYGGGYTPSGSSDVTVGDVIGTNAQWYSAAFEAATNAGFESLLTAGALGKFLARQPLTSAEASVVRVGLAAAGQPPQGQPWSIVPESGPSKTPAPGHVSKPPAPKNLHVISVSGTTAKIGWDSVAWVSGYVVFVDGSEHGPMHYGTWYTLRNLKPGHHTVSVRTMNRYRVVSDPASVTVTITAPKIPSKPQSSGKR